jgi:hypothetical protein
MCALREGRNVISMGGSFHTDILVQCGSVRDSLTRNKILVSYIRYQKNSTAPMKNVQVAAAFYPEAAVVQSFKSFWKLVPVLARF